MKKAMATPAKSLLSAKDHTLIMTDLEKWYPEADLTFSPSLSFSLPETIKQNAAKSMQQSDSTLDQSALRPTKRMSMAGQMILDHFGFADNTLDHASKASLNTLKSIFIIQIE